jgi:endonuclease YncB( thermonuclease family)
MNGFIKSIPLLVLLVLGVLGIKGIGRGTPFGEHRSGNTGTLTKIPNSKLCEIVSGSVHDGDTVRVKCGDAIARIRLACIDSREIKQTGGVQDRNFLRSLINKHGSTVALIPLEQDRYGRTVAELILRPGETPEISVQEELLKSGHAMIYEQYASNCPNLPAFRLAQEIAQKNKAGVWGDPNPEPPWEWRKRNK